MLLKKLKKMTVLQSLLLAAAFAIMITACGEKPGGKTNEEEEIPQSYINEITGVRELADVTTLTLQPGNDNTEINLNWYSSNAATNNQSKVKFVRGTFTAGYELLNQQGNGVTDSAGTTGKNQHKATVKGLKPGQSYQYVVSSDGTNWSATYDFKVPAATGAWKFAVIADPQLTTGNVDSNSRYPATGTTTAAGWAETMGILMTKGISLIASGGDQVDASGGNETEYNNFFAPEGLRTLPLAPVSGNHDNHLNFNYHYNVPNTNTEFDGTGATEKGRNYFYLYNNILFVVLDTAPYPSTSIATAQPYVNRFAATIDAAKTAHAGKYDWLIVQHHKSTASVANHIADTDIQRYVEAGFEKVMSDKGVDFVLAGHDHVYARSWPLAGRDNGYVSVPDKSTTSQDTHTVTAIPGKPIYLTFTTASGLKYYQVSWDKTFVFTDYLGSKNANYPYLGEITGTSGQEKSTQLGRSDYETGNYRPPSNIAYCQPWIPSYCIAEVNGKTIKFSTYAIATKSGTHGLATETYSFNKDVPYDWVQVTKN